MGFPVDRLPEPGAVQDSTSFTPLRQASTQRKYRNHRKWSIEVNGVGGAAIKSGNSAIREKEPATAASGRSTIIGCGSTVAIQTTMPSATTNDTRRTGDIT